MTYSIPYTGKSEYCYANSVAMLLSSIGENISPNKMDFAEFFSARNRELAVIKNNQAKLFGHAHAYAVQKLYQDFAKVLREITKTEEAFYEQLITLS